MQKLNSFELHLLERHDSKGMAKKDGFQDYARDDPIKVESLEVHNPINWWRDHQWLHHTTPLALALAPDTSATPAVPSEHKRVFSSAKKLLTPEKNALVDDTIEVTECSSLIQ
jgi:hypothetical protein